MALPGPKNDKGFNQSHYDGLIAAGEKYGFTPNVVENVVDPQARIDALKNLAADNPLVIGVGGEYADAGLTAAPQFPDVDVRRHQRPDGPGHPEPARLLRAPGCSGLHRRGRRRRAHRGQQGRLPGRRADPADDAVRRRLQGRRRRGRSDIEYASTIVGNFNDPEKAKEAASAQINAGADVIFALLDAGFPGVEQAVTESGKDVLLINPIFPRCDEGDRTSSASPSCPRAGWSTRSSTTPRSGALPTEPQFYGVENNEIQRFELCEGFAEHQALVDETTDAINAGDVELPEGV